MAYTFSENLPLAFLKVKSLQSSIDLLLILEQYYNNDTAALEAKEPDSNLVID